MNSDISLNTISSGANQSKIQFGEFASIKASLEADSSNRESILTALERYSDLLTRIQDDNTVHELEMFNFLCDFLSLQLAQLSEKISSGIESVLNEDYLNLLLRWPSSAAAYLAEPTCLINREMLTDIMLDSAWPGPLEDIDRQELINLLSPANETIDETDEDLEEEPRCTEARPEDLVVAMDPDVSPKLVDVFFIESAENITDLNDSFAKIASGDQEWQAIIADAQRLAHNLKGSANLVGSIGMANLTHHLEDILEYLTRSDLPPSPSLCSTLLEAGVCLEQMYEAIEAGTGTPQNALSVLQDVLDWANKMDRGELSKELSQATEEVNLSEHEDSPTNPVESDPTEPVQDQLSPIFTEFGLIQSALEVNSKNSESLPEILEQYSNLLSRVQESNAAQQLEMFAFICDYLSLQLAQLSEGISSGNDTDLKQDNLILLLKWPECAAAYLSKPDDLVNRESLADITLSPTWPGHLEDIERQELINLLATSNEFIEDIEDDLHEEARSTEASPEDVEIDLDPNVSAKLIDVFFLESSDNITDLNERLQQVAKDKQEWKESLADAQRLAHNLKGSANLVGSVGIANLTHHLEDLLEYLVRCEQPPIAALCSTLLEAGVCLEEMFEAIRDGTDAPENAQTVLQDVLDWANQMDSGELAKKLAQYSEIEHEIKQVTEINKEASAEQEQDKVKANDDSHEVTITEEQPLAPVLSAGKPVSTTKFKSEKAKSLRVSTNIVSDLWDSVESMAIALDQIRGQFDSLKAIQKEWRKSTANAQVQQAEFESYIDAYNLNSIKQSSVTDQSDELFDPLEMDQFTELQTVSRSFIESVADNKSISDTLFDNMAKIDRLLEPFTQKKYDLQQTVMNLRLVPFNTISAKLHRCVTHACQTLNKEAVLNIEGETKLVDTEILEKLSDPLMHMLRNAVDHGIETPSVRKSKNKPTTGVINLKISIGGQNIIVECEDDGAGLNYEKIKHKGIESNLITDSDNVSHDELSRLIFQRGFSTSSSLTQMSGRGVGMDVVYETIRSLKGKMDIGDAAIGGCRIAFELPMLTISNHCIVVEIQRQLFAIPTWTVARMIAPNTGRYISIEGEQYVQINQEKYPAANLSEKLGLQSEVKQSDKNPFLLITTSIGTLAIEVDRFVDTYNLIIKNLGDYIPSMYGILGVSLLPNGSLIPVLDALELFDPSTERSSELRTEHDLELNRFPGLDAEEKKNVLIVDDSISMRHALSDFVDKFGFNAILARDGMEAIELMRDKLPDIVLTDIEMPRMNGYELSTYIRTNYGSELPIIAISSRSMKKHRAQAKAAGVSQYLTKPFSEDVLLSNIKELLSIQD